jgi:hypothetical protein
VQDKNNGGGGSCLSAFTKRASIHPRDFWYFSYIFQLFYWYVLPCHVVRPRILRGFLLPHKLEQTFKAKVSRCPTTGTWHRTSKTYKQCLPKLYKDASYAQRSLNDTALRNGRDRARAHTLTGAFGVVSRYEASLPLLLLSLVMVLRRMSEARGSRSKSQHVFTKRRAPYKGLSRKIERLSTF